MSPPGLLVRTLRSLLSLRSTRGDAHQAWRQAQDVNLRWYTERMFKPTINAWNPLFDFFADRLDQSGKTVLEIGPGPVGGLLRHLTAGRKIAVEPLAQAFLDNGFQDIASGDILYLDCLGERIPLVDGAIDIACCMHSLGHAERPFDILAECRRLLSNSGELWIMELMRTPEQTTAEHPVALDEAALIGWLEDHGFAVTASDNSAVHQENDFALPVLTAVCTKERLPCEYAPVIDFSVGNFSRQAAGGWHQLEEGQRPARWTSDVFQSFVGREAGEERLSIEGYAVVDHFPEQTLDLHMEINGLDVGHGRLTETGPFSLSWPLPAGLGHGRLEIIGRCSAHFIPAEVQGGGDDRELSLLVFRLGVE